MKMFENVLSVIGKLRDSLLGNKVVLVGVSLSVGLPAVYVLDVWLLGTAAAWLYDLAALISRDGVIGLLANDGALHDFGNANWHWHHPFQTAWMWLTKSSTQLSNPGARKVWVWVNLLVAFAGVILFAWRPWRGLRGANNSRYVHGLKIIKNPGLGLARWAGLKDLKRFCEFGPPVPLRKNLNNRVKFPGGNLIGKLDDKIIRVNFEKVPKDMPKTAPHSIAYGGTGSGKSFTYVSGNIIAAVSEGQSIVAIDPKGELFETFAKWLKLMGYEVWALNFMTPKHSHRWDPVIECQDDAEISE
ncbi:MAG: type IV secretory system conjugative DNA transfer family protein, partial [Methylomicrobium sp.]|nr:type IV secretory system conjugative DNA transfer family protein [Methylomicrobium sp.]